MVDTRLDSFKQAIKMEKDGKSFYEQSAGKAQNKFTQNVFNDLAGAEEKHIVKLTSIYKSLEESGNWPDLALTRDPSETIANIFTHALESIDEKVTGSETDISALKMAMQLENDGIKFYQSKADETDDPFQKKFFMLLSKEESEHFISILDTIEYLEDPQGYFSQLERGTLSF
ncbi:MAG: ferritin family protein [Deltaproteobacteria bacterium]|nr:ferritin family protein [Deltaproteobacteria bacterium]